jgi:hypothetical protein
MKAYTVNFEARITVVAHDEWRAIDKAKAILGDSDLLMPTYVSDAYVHLWEPNKEVTPPKIDDEVPF